MNPRHRILILIAICAAAAVLFATARYGIGISSESETYIMAARHLAGGEGVSIDGANGQPTLLTQHAPLYAAVLGVTRLNTLDAARWCSAICFAGIVFLTGLLAAQISQRTWLPAVASLATALAVPLLDLQLTALSEPLFLLCALAGWYGLLRYFEDRSRRWLLLGAAAWALASLTRFGGVVLIAAGALALFELRRPARAIAFTLTAGLPLAAWLTFAHVHAGNAAAREFAFHAATPRDFLAGLHTLSTWLLPSIVPEPIRVAFLIATLLAGAMLYRRLAPHPKLAIHTNACRALLLFAGLYAAFILIARSFFDRAIPFDDRILSPLYVPLLLTALLLLDAALQLAGPRRRLVIPAAAALPLLCSIDAVRDTTMLLATHAKGREYTSAAWRQSQLTQWLASVDATVPVYSNLDSAVRFLHGGPIRGLPAKLDVRSGRANSSYAGDLQRMNAEFEKSQGVIIYFQDAAVPKDALPTPSELASALNLEVIATGDRWLALSREKTWYTDERR